MKNQNSIFPLLVFTLLCLFACTPKLLPSVSNTPKLLPPPSNLTESECYDIEFLRAIRSSKKENQVQVMYLVQPKYEAAFPPILSMGLKYTTKKNAALQYIDIQKPKSTGRVTVVIFGNTMPKEAPYLSSLVADRIEEKTRKEDYLVLLFNFIDLVDSEETEMKMVYGLWEKKYADTRVEKSYDFEIENIE